MAYPVIYNVVYSYTGFQQAQQGISAFPGTQLDNDLAGLQNSVSNLALFITGALRSDGALNNGSVTFDSLSPALKTAGITPATPWATGVSYGKDITVTINNGLYRALAAHVSGVFATDLAAGKWVLIASLSAGTSLVESVATARSIIFSLATTAIRSDGYAQPGDGGEGIYIRGTAGGLGAWQDAGGVWWNLAYNGTVNLKALGAGQGSAAADAVAILAAAAAQGPVVNGQQTGIKIFFPGGNYDFSTVQALFTRDGTWLIGDTMRIAAIKFNPAASASLFTFFRSGDAQGISNCGMKNLNVYSTNAVQKHILTCSNSASFDLINNFMFGITDAGGGSIAIVYQGRNWLKHKRNFITADYPFYFNTNPDRALAGFEDADFTIGVANQYATSQVNGSIYTVPTGIQVTNWSADNEDWAGGRFGVNNVDTTASQTSYNWNFRNCRREQETGASPTMLYIRRSANILRNLSCESALVGLGQFANLSGVERAEFTKTTINTGGINIITADATVSGLSWKKLFCGTGNTVTLSGQTLVRGREKMGGTNAAPIYTDAEYTNSVEGTIEWVGAPSTSTGRRIGIWRKTEDVAVFTGANDFVLSPWSIYTIQHARISLTSSGISGDATFQIGQVAPAGDAVLSSQTNFAVDGNAAHLSVFHFSDTHVGIINKTAAPLNVAVKVEFVI